MTVTPEVCIKVTCTCSYIIASFENIKFTTVQKLQETVLRDYGFSTGFVKQCAVVKSVHWQFILHIRYGFTYMAM
jgi:hypothetical protein